MPPLKCVRRLCAATSNGWIRYRPWAFVLGWTIVCGATMAAAQPPALTPTAPTLPAAAAPAQADPVSPAQQSGTQPKFVESARRWADEHQILKRLSGDVDGWYPRLGGMTRGSGFALGPGYRTHVLDDRVLVDASAAITIRRYKAVDVRARWLQTWNERVEVWTDYRFEDFPQEDFYGLGPDTVESMRTSYAIRGSDFTVRAQVKPLRWLRTGLNVGYLSPKVGPGRDREFPSIEEVFPGTSLPGLLEQPDFIHTQLFAEVDYRDTPGNPRRGGFYRAAYSTWDDRTLEAYNFRRFDTNLAQFAPLTADRKHIVSGRVGLSFVNNAPGDRVPFYALPYVGGTDTVRSYREFRFKEENAMWLGVEYRWIPIKWVSGVLFADAGKVARNWQDVIDAADMKQGYGFGVAVHSSKQTFARIDFGFGGGEGRRIFLKLGPSF